MILLYIGGVVMMLLLYGACDNRAERVEPFGWTSATPAVDSLTRLLEYSFACTADVDSLERLVGEYEEICRREVGDSALAARIHFWRGRLLYRRGRYDEARKEIDRAVAMTDSSRLPYDVKRFRWLFSDQQNYTAEEWYTLLIEELDFYREQNCLLMQADRAVAIGWMMIEAGHLGSAFEYFSLADSLFGVIGMPQPIAGNRVNMADLLYKSGDTAGAVAMFRDLRVLEAVVEDPELSTLIDYNLYVIGRDSAALRQAWASLRNDTTRPGLRGLVAAHLGGEAIGRGDLARAATFIGDAEKYLPSVLKGDHRAFIQNQIMRFYLATKDVARSSSAFAGYSRTMDSLLEEKNRGALIAAETSRQIARAEQKAERRRQATVIRLSLLILGIVVAVVTGAVVIRRRVIRLRENARRDQMAREESQRAELAMSLRMKEKEGLLEQMEGKLEGLVRAGVLTDRDISEIRSALKSESIVGEESHQFARIFAKLSPEFIENLRHRYTGVGKNSEKLACYIVIGMDNRHIARIMNIRQESVRQARWRLRTQMALPSEQNLEETLRSLL